MLAATTNKPNILVVHVNSPVRNSWSVDSFPLTYDPKTLTPSILWHRMDAVIDASEYSVSNKQKGKKTAGRLICLLNPPAKK